MAARSVRRISHTHTNATGIAITTLSTEPGAGHCSNHAISVARQLPASMIKRVTRSEAEVFPLPGRDWHTYIGPQNTPTERVSLGVSVFPPGSKPAGHVHDIQEETIYCAAGRGRIVTPEASAEIEAGVTVWVPPGVFHATESDGPEPLELVCFFSPPVVPGSYEKKATS